MLAGLAAAGLGYVLGFFSGDRGGRDSPSKSAPAGHTQQTYDWRMHGHFLGCRRFHDN